MLQTHGEALNPTYDTDIKSIIEQEFGWLVLSGISISGELIDGDRSIFIEWSIDDVRERTDTLALVLSDSDCLSILKSVENNHDAKPRHYLRYSQLRH